MARRKPVAAHKAMARSAVTNGRELLRGVDGRSWLARRYRDIMSALASDQGGVAHLSEARLQLIRRFSACAVLAEELEAKLANGQSINLQEHALLSSTLVRLAQRIGIDRRAKNITPNLREYIDIRANRADDTESVEAQS